MPLNEKGIENMYRPSLGDLRNLKSFNIREDYVAARSFTLFQGETRGKKTIFECFSEGKRLSKHNFQMS